LIYIIGFVAVGIIGWHVLKWLIGFIALRRNPVKAGQVYIKASLRKNSSINVGLIPDEAYKQVALHAYELADFSHEALRQHLTSAYMSNLDLYVQQIHIIMTGHGTDLDNDIAEILNKYGVRIPKA
jgi:hypothetical protein